MPRPIAEPGDEVLSKREAIAFLGLDEKTFENYFRVAAEFSCLEREGGGGMFYFSKAALEAWKASFAWRSTELTLGDYSLCLDFALAQHFRGYVASDFGTGRQREFGQKITNWVKGQLAEVAVKKFFEREFGTPIELDFEIRDDIVPQDIIQVTKDGVSRIPRVGVGIKASKPKSAYLILGENEVHLEGRRSDYYILCRPDIPDDHLLRLTKERIIGVVRDQPHFHLYWDHMPGFANIACEVAGWCRIAELEEVTSIGAQEFEVGSRFVRQSGLLHRDRASWEELISAL
jgi:hypothetical protein